MKNNPASLLLPLWTLLFPASASATQVLTYPFSTDHDSTITNNFAGHAGYCSGCQGIDYHSHLELVYAPYDGDIARAVDLYPEHTFIFASYGNYVAITSTDGSMRVIMAHLAPGLLVRQGQSVSAGDAIGYTSDTGYTVGNDPSPTYYHLHFEVERSGVDVDPYGGDLFLIDSDGSYRFPEEVRDCPPTTVLDYDDPPVPTRMVHFYEQGAVCDGASYYLESDALTLMNRGETDPGLANPTVTDNGGDCDDADALLGGDLSGDGITDVVQVVHSGRDEFTAHVWIAEGDGTFSDEQIGLVSTAGQPDRYFLADESGDGRDDLVVAYDDGAGTIRWYTCRSNGVGFDACQRWATDFGQSTADDVFVVGDVTGDGRADVVRGFNNSDTRTVCETGGYKLRWKMLPAGTQADELWYDGWGCADSTYLLANVNGDASGRKDLVQVRFDAADTGHVFVALSDGGAFDPDGEWKEDFGSPFHDYYVLDVDGDGKEDLLEYRDNSVDAISWTRSSGTAFGSRTVLAEVDIAGGDFLFGSFGESDLVTGSHTVEDCGGGYEPPELGSASPGDGCGSADGDGDGLANDLDDCDDSRVDVYVGAPELWYDGVDQDCEGGSDYDQDADGQDATPWGGDCDDTDAAVFLGAADAPYDGLDADCAGDSDFDVDLDGDDASPWGDDCNDADPSVYPGAPDSWYDGVDSDCLGNSDFDQDGDGYDTLSSGGDDCDDLDAAIRPGVRDAWYDGLDSDCLGNSDFDRDGDGADATTFGGTDCDDTDAAVFVGAIETWYDGIDSDCSGGSDLDQDGDGAPLATDCDDLDPAVSPGAAEIWYDGIDSDCSGGSDLDQDGDGADATAAGGDDCNDRDPDVFPGAIDAAYDGLDADCLGDSDFDRDGDGADATSAGGTDCDDTNAAVYVGAIETWYDGIDSDCSGGSDLDQDGDGAPLATDCDDLDPAVSPGAAETWYDGIDSDCSGGSDLDQDGDGADATAAGGDDCNDRDPGVFPGAIDAAYDGLDADCLGDSDFDRDGDGADAATAGGTDCDDTNAAVYVGATETWYDGIDDDCDGADDDQDGDGHPLATDCNELDVGVHPGAPESCDGRDEDCDGLTDEGEPNGSGAWYADLDGDGFGDLGLMQRSCAAPAGFVSGADDCDDSDADVFPGAEERCNGVDDDCSGKPGLDEIDADGDGFLACKECADDDAGRHPGADEVPNGIDADCDRESSGGTVGCASSATSPGWFAGLFGLLMLLRRGASPRPVAPERRRASGRSVGPVAMALSLTGLVGAAEAADEHTGGDAAEVMLDDAALLADLERFSAAFASAEAAFSPTMLAWAASREAGGALTMQLAASLRTSHEALSRLDDAHTIATSRNAEAAHAATEGHEALTAATSGRTTAEARIGELQAQLHAAGRRTETARAALEAVAVTDPQTLRSIAEFAAIHALDDLRAEVESQEAAAADVLRHLAPVFGPAAARLLEAAAAERSIQHASREALTRLPALRDAESRARETAAARDATRRNAAAALALIEAERAGARARNHTLVSVQEGLGTPSEQDPLLDLDRAYSALAEALRTLPGPRGAATWCPVLVHGGMVRAARTGDTARLSDATASWEGECDSVANGARVIPALDAAWVQAWQARAGEPPARVQIETAGLTSLRIDGARADLAGDHVVVLGAGQHRFDAGFEGGGDDLVVTDLEPSFGYTLVRTDEGLAIRPVLLPEAVIGHVVEVQTVALSTGSRGGARVEGPSLSFGLGVGESWAHEQLFHVVGGSLLIDPDWRARLTLELSVASAVGHRETWLDADTAVDALGVGAASARWYTGRGRVAPWLALGAFGEAGVGGGGRLGAGVSLDRGSFGLDLSASASWYVQDSLGQLGAGILLTPRWRTGFFEAEPG